MVETGGLTSPIAAQRPTNGARVVLIAGAAVVAVLAVAGAWFFFGDGGYATPARARPSIPPSLSGTLSELPVDVDPQSPARTMAFATLSLGGAGRDRVLATALPRGVDARAVASRWGAASAAIYQTGAKSPAIRVAALDVRRGARAAETLARQLQRATGGALSAIRVRSPSGAAYPGYSVRTVELLVHVLANPSGSRVIVLWVSQPSLFPVAGRLAASVGSGERVVGEPVVRGTFAALPAKPPAGLVLEEIRSLTPRDAGTSRTGLDGTVSATLDASLRPVIASLRTQTPVSLTTARWRDPEGNPWSAAMADYGSSHRGRWLWWAARSAAGRSMERVRVSGVECLYKEGTGRLLMFRKGPYLAVVETPARASSQQLAEFMASLQL